MRSTGEVLGLASNFGEAFFKAQEATQTVLPLSGTVLITVNNRDKEEAVDVAREFERAGFSIIATAGTGAMLESMASPATPSTSRARAGPTSWTPSPTERSTSSSTRRPPQESAVDDSYIRKAAIKAHVPYMTTLAAAMASALGIQAVKDASEASVMSLQDIHATIV